jgi:hypothetical protein
MEGREKKGAYAFRERQAFKIRIPNISKPRLPVTIPQFRTLDCLKKEVPPAINTHDHPRFHPS